MSRLERSIRWIWAVNGVAIFITILTVLTGIIIWIASTNFFIDRDHPEETVTEVAGKSIEGTKLKLGQFRELKGTDYLRAYLGTPTEYLGSGSSRTLVKIRNYLYLNKRDRSTRWLLPNNSHEIDLVDSFYSPAECIGNDDQIDRCEKSQELISSLIEIIPLSENGDAKEGNRSLALIPPDGTAVDNLVTNIDGILGTHAIDMQRALVIYTKNGKVRLLELNPVAKKLIADEPLSEKTNDSAQQGDER